MDPRDRLNQALADRYRLQEELGRGGMAIVYRARDLRHERSVALKVLLPRVVAAVGPDRFLREIELAAGLTHPNILPVFDSGRVDDLLFYVMPYVEGESVRDRISREGRLPLDDALRIAGEVAGALDHAHRRGIVHRDIKPGNILLADGHSFLADFGVALPIGPEIGQPLTRTGLAIGTPAYMSPEQAAGVREIDGRSDVYSLGCVLYEMLAGSLPFEGETPQLVLVRRLTDEPAPIRSVRKDVPAGVEDALSRALEREAAGRFATAAEFREALLAGVPVRHSAASAVRRIAHRMRRRLLPHPVAVPVVGMLVVAVVAALLWQALGSGGTARDGSEAAAAGEASAQPVSVAVMVPRNPSGDPELAGIAEAVADELIRRLGTVEGLETRSLGAVLPFTQASVLPSAIGETLDVDYLIETTILGSPDRLRLSATLVEASSGAVLDEGSHEAVRGEVLGLVDSLTADVSFSLRQQLGREFRVRELRAQTDVEPAWLAVREAEIARRRAVEAAARGGEDRQRALALLDRSDSLLVRASLLDADWAQPHVQSGWNLLERAMAQGEEARAFDPDDRVHLRAALDASGRALARDSASAGAMALRGTTLHALASLAADSGERDRLDGEAEAWLERAIATDPARVDALLELADHARFHDGDSERALDLMDQAWEADRWRADADVLLSGIAELATDIPDYDRALSAVREGRRRWPENLNFPAIELMALASDGTDVDAAWALGETVAELAALDRTDPYVLLMQSQVARVISRAGLPDSARGVLERVEAGTARIGEEDYLAYDLAHAWLVYGDTARALDWLEVELAAYPDKRAMRAAESWFRPLHGNPRFEELVAGSESREPSGD